MHCETRRAVKNNPEDCNGDKVDERGCFRVCGTYHFYNVKKIPPDSGDFYGRISTRNFPLF